MKALILLGFLLLIAGCDKPVHDVRSWPDPLQTSSDARSTASVSGLTYPLPNK